MEQQTPVGQEHYETPRKQLFYILRSYIVKKSDVDLLFSWAKTKNFAGGWLPESRELYEVFLGEFFWAPAYEHNRLPDNEYDSWSDDTARRIPVKLLLPTDGYMNESSGFDCSIDDNIFIQLPAKWLVDGMQLRWNGVEGYFFDAKGKLIIFDPSVKTRGPKALLARKSDIVSFLNNNGYSLVWTIQGEKNIVGGSDFGQDWKGRLEISGVYRLNEGVIDGLIIPRFRPPKA